MGSILDKIVENRKALIAGEKKKLPPEKLKEEVMAVREKTPAVSFLSLREKGRPFLIAEIKKASPSKGIIRKDFDPREIARAYGKSRHVSAVSVLTEPDFFQGNYDYLRWSGEVMDRPRLMKDFIVDEYQVYRGALLGASGFLLIAAVLSDEEIVRLVETGNTLGMTALLEVHSPEEYRRALGTGSRLIGINNRDLNTFVTDIRTTASILEKEGKPVEGIIISESGITTHRDIAFLTDAGADGFLIGETFMRSHDMVAEIEQVMEGH